MELDATFENVVDTTESMIAFLSRYPGYTVEIEALIGCDPVIHVDTAQKVISFFVWSD